MLPEPFDPAIYRDRNPELAHLTPPALAAHYAAAGRAEGRNANAIFGRGEFQGIVPRDRPVLEIGPYASPSLFPDRHRVEYLDWMTTEEIAAAAQEMPWVDPARLPRIDHVWRGQPYAELVGKRFGSAFSCHAIEHQPDLVRHLRDVASILEPNGRYFLIAPDHRYCFDHFQAPSTIADVLDAHLEARTKHSFRNVLAHRLLLTHNDAPSHWAGDNGDDPAKLPASAVSAERILTALRDCRGAPGYMDTHAWFLTPDSFAAILDHLAAAKLVPLRLERLYPTLRDTFEFGAVLRAA